MIKVLNTEYDRRKSRIKKRLKEFRVVWKKPDRKIFSELCFCICTPQSKAVYCDKAVSGLEKTGVLFRGKTNEIKEGLKAVRFPNNKARYIFEARELFSTSKGIKIKDKIDAGDIPRTRAWLVENVKGIGLKEASHFLRNIGFGRDLAILDVHILKNMVRYGLIEEVPKSITKRRYLSLEDRLRDFSKKINISMGELDLLLWAAETGMVFK